MPPVRSVFADADLTDRPAVSTQFTSFTYQNAADQNITASLTPQQQADVAALEASLVLTPSSQTPMTARLAGR